MKSLDNIRKNIDEIDNQLLELLNNRARLAIQVKATSQGKTAIRPEREASIIRRVSIANRGPLPARAVKSIFTHIIATFRDEMQLDRPITISYLGPTGTYSEEAATMLFGETVTLFPQITITSVILAVDRGEADIAVVPMENSSEGSVTETHKRLLETSSPIISETILPINHCLLSNETAINRISSVYGHPQALAQCREWLATHLPRAELISSNSNALAGEQASKHVGSAAVASKKVGEIYNLKVIKKMINDNPDNQTRFIALGKLYTKPTGNDKTSIMCVLQDRAGALHELLKPLAQNKISMTRLTSQPYTKGQYVFYIDLCGHQDDPGIKEMFDEMKKQTVAWKVLGSYPQTLS